MFNLFQPLCVAPPRPGLAAAATVLACSTSIWPGPDASTQEAQDSTERPADVVINSATQRQNGNVRSDVILTFPVETDAIERGFDEASLSGPQRQTATRVTTVLDRRLAANDPVAPYRLDLQVAVTNTGGVISNSEFPIGFNSEFKILIGDRFSGLDPDRRWRLRLDAPTDNVIGVPLSENTGFAGIFLADGREVVPQLTASVNGGEQVSEAFTIPAGQTYFLTYFLQVGSTVDVSANSTTQPILGINAEDDLRTVATLIIEPAVEGVVVPSPSAAVLGLGLMGLCLSRRARWGGRSGDGRRRGRGGCSARRRRA